MGAGACRCNEKPTAEHNSIEDDTIPKDTTDSIDRQVSEQSDGFGRTVSFGTGSQRMTRKTSNFSSRNTQTSTRPSTKASVKTSGRNNKSSIFARATSSGSDGRQTKVTGILSGAPDWVRKFTSMFGAPPEDDDQLADEDVDEDVEEYDYDDDDDEMAATTSIACVKRSALVQQMLPFLAVDDPDDINNVYTFSKEVISDGGGTGVSRRATVKFTGALRAVKFVPQTLDADKMASIRISVGIAATFDHPNLMNVHEIFEDRDYMYLVMSYCPGNSLQERLKQGTLSEVKAVIVIRQLLRAILYLHSNKICHRDVKPSNIFFNSPADEIMPSCLIRLSSFGSAIKKLHGQKFPKDIVGSLTPGYMAPEMVIDTLSYNYGVDMWGAGVVIFETLCGRLPFPTDAKTEKEFQVQFKDDLDHNVTSSARDLITLLLECDPRVRYKVRQALQHKWLEKGLAKLGGIPFDATTLANLKKFRNLTPFQQASLRIIAGRLSDVETMNSRLLFCYLDQDGDGNLVPAEIESFIAADPKIKAAFPDVAEIFKQTSHRDDTVVELAFTYTEFVAATFNRQQCLTEEACRAAFHVFDRDGDHFISIAELSDGYLLGDVTPEKLKKMFEDVDTDGDHQISFKEFVAMMKQS